MPVDDAQPARIQMDSIFTKTNRHVNVAGNDAKYIATAKQACTDIRGGKTFGRRAQSSAAWATTRPVPASSAPASPSTVPTRSPRSGGESSQEVGIGNGAMGLEHWSA